MKTAILSIIALTAAGCGGSKSTQSAAKSEAAPKAEYFHVDAATAGKLHGRIVYAGPKPTRRAIPMESDLKCSQEHAGQPAYDEPVAVGTDGGLANAFVYIQTGLDGKKFEPRKEA